MGVFLHLVLSIKLVQVAGEIDRVVVPTHQSEQQMLDSLREEAIEMAITAGAMPDTIKVVQLDLFQLPYISTRAVRGVVKAVSTALSLLWGMSY